MTMTMPTRTVRKAFLAAQSTVAIVLSMATYWLLQVWPLTSSAGFSWRNFRQYFPYDQYSYLAIAVDVSNGNFAAVEPFTETGANHYPRLYYVFLGLVSKLFGTDIVLTWQIAGLAIQLVMVAAISWLIIRLTGIPVLGVLGFVPSIVGTFAVVTSGDWHQSLDNHGVLWGAFGVLFTLNGESAALSLAIIAICLLIGATFSGAVAAPRAGGLGRTVTIVAASAAIGVLANVQTYSFLTAVYLLMYVAGAYGLLRYGRWPHVITSLVLLAATLLGGPLIATTAGPLVTLVLGVLGAVPGFVLLLLRFRATVIAACVALALAASPTILGTLLGIAGKDDFLIYREQSSKALGVPLWTGLLAALVPLIFLVIIFWAGARQRNKTWLAFSIGAAFAWPIVASNDLWGANQEPYRFWIDSFTIVTAVMIPVLLQVACVTWKGHRASSGALVAAGPLGEEHPTPTSTYPRRRSPRIVPILAAVLATTVAAASVVDYSKFAEYVHSYGTASFNDPQAVAIKTAAGPLTETSSALRIQVDSAGRASELVMFDPCISPFRLKTLTGLPTAFYNLGLAWPSHEADIREVLAQRGNGAFAQQLAEGAGVKYVMTDSGCPGSWQGKVNGQKISEVSYNNGGLPAVISLWQIGKNS